MTVSTESVPGVSAESAPAVSAGSDVAAPIAPRLGWPPSGADSMADAGRADLPVRDARIERAELR